jgi:uncharacterized membrane protein YtjA (UPF0391 family)
VISSVVFVVSVVYVVSSVGHEHDNIVVVSVVPAGETIFWISGLLQSSLGFMNLADVSAWLS